MKTPTAEILTLTEISSKTVNTGQKTQAINYDGGKRKLYSIGMILFYFFTFAPH